MRTYAVDYEFGEQRRIELRLPECLFYAGKRRETREAVGKVLSFPVGPARPCTVAFELEGRRYVHLRLSRGCLTHQEELEKEIAHRLVYRTRLFYLHRRLAETAEQRRIHLIAFEHCRRTVLKWFPAYWPLVEAWLSTAATLKLRDIPASIALFAMGESGAGKNTVLKMFGWDLERLIVWRDKFSLASIQSSYGDEKDSKKLGERALFRRASHKILATAELGLLFRGKTQTLQERFGELAQLLDGEGRIVDSGTHGALGSKGDFTFVWFGGTTPFHLDTWRTMATLGTRLLFFRVAKGPYVQDELYVQAIRECKRAVNQFLDVLVPDGSVRTVEWPTLDGQIGEVIKRYAALTAIGHGSRNNIDGDSATAFPTSNHFRSRLGQLVRGRALVHARSSVDQDDLQMARWLTLSSMPLQRGPVLIALFEGLSEAVEIAKATGLSFPTVSSTLDKLKELGIVVKETPDAQKVGRPARTWTINDELFQAAC